MTDHENAKTIKASKETRPNALEPETPIDGSSLRQLEVLDRKGDAMHHMGNLTNTDLAFLLNIPTQQLSALRTAKSSADVIDRRVSRNTPASQGQRKTGQSLKCIRPYHAILIRLFLKYPEYATIIPPYPMSREVFDLIQPFMRPPGEPLEEPNEKQKRWFGQLFGRSLIISYKMLSTDPQIQMNRNNSRPVVQLQTLILLRFAKIFRELYTQYRDRFLPLKEQRNPLYLPEALSWDVLRERDSLTDWMDDKLYESFETDLLERWRQWWDTKYMTTLRLEAESRDIGFEDVLKTGQWQTKERVTSFKDYPRNAKPITGADTSLLTLFRDMTKLSSSEFVWLLGISPKTYFMYRKRPEERIDAATSILLRHFYLNPDDLDLFIRTPNSPLDLLQTIQEADPTFERKQLGILLGGGAIAGYNMTRPNAEVPSFARRAASLMTEHFEYSNSIYWHIRECAEVEAKARGLDLDELWSGGSWHQSEDDDDANQHGHPDSELDE